MFGLIATHPHSALLYFNEAGFNEMASQSKKIYKGISRRFQHHHEERINSNVDSSRHDQQPEREITALLDRAWDEHRAFGDASGLGFLRCGIQHLDGPTYSYFKPAFVKFVDQASSRVQALGNMVMNAVSSFVNDSLLEFMETAGSIERCKDLAKEAAAKGCIKQIEQLEGINSDSHPGSDSAQLLEIRTKAVVSSLSELVEDVAAKLIRPAVQLGSFLLDEAVALNMRIVDGVCGLFPEASTSICTVLRNALRKRSSTVLTEFMHTGAQRIQRDIHTNMLQNVQPVMAGSRKINTHILKALERLVNASLPTAVDEFRRCDVRRKDFAEAKP
jgi:hypothetical protein